METEQHYRGPPSQTPQPKQKQNYAPKIRVCIRKRPLNNKEKLKNEKDIVKVMNGKEVKVKEKKVAHYFLFLSPILYFSFLFSYLLID